MSLSIAGTITLSAIAAAIAVEIGCIVSDRRDERRFKAAMRAKRAVRPRVIDSPTFAAAIHAANAQLAAIRHAATAPAIAQAIQSARPALPDLPDWTAPDAPLPDDSAAFSAPPALRRPVLILENPEA